MRNFCTSCRERTRRRMVKVYQDGRDSIPKCIKRFEVLLTSATCQSSMLQLRTCQPSIHLLRHSVSICQRLQVPEVVLVFDEAIYAKAQMIRWKHDELKKRLVIRLGDFHTVMSFCSAISSNFQGCRFTGEYYC